MSSPSQIFGIFLANDNFYFIFILISIFSVFWYTWFFTKPKTPASSQPLPPGPRGLPVVGNLPFLDPKLHSYFHGLALKYGPIFKLWLGSKLIVVVTSTTLGREVFKDQDINFSNRDVPVTARALTYGGIDVAWLPYGPEWRMVRKACVVNLLSRHTLDSFYHLRRQEVRERVRYMYGQARERSRVNIGDQMFLTMLNLMMNMLWGGTVKGEEVVNLGTEFKKVVSEAVRLLGEPNVSDFFPSLARFDLQGHVKSMRRQARELDDIFNRVIEQCQRIQDDGSEESKDFLQYLLKLKEEEGDSEIPLTLNHIKALLMDLVVAGTDTSSHTIEFAMAELITNPEIMKRAQQELDEVVGKDNIVEESHISKLPYVFAVVKETLRLHPTTPLLLPRTPTEATVVGGYVVPRGARVLVNAWAIHRDPELWRNPSEFLPERFLEKAYDFTGSDHSFIPFGSGRRICAGVALAERMVLYALATLLHSFDWKIPEGETYEMEETFGIVLKLKNPLVLLPVPRLSDPSLYL